MNTKDSQTGILSRKRVQCAFKDLMIHGILQFTLRIAFRCVLHRCESLEIRCQKLFIIINKFQTKIKRSLNYFGDLCARESKSPQRHYIAQVFIRILEKGLGVSRKSLQTRPSPRNTQIFNDPTAGSPTVTLLRLLVPLNDQV
jgi:hypothetical protein